MPVIDARFFKIGLICLVLITFFASISSTILGDFFRWIPFLGISFFTPMMYFVVKFQGILSAFCISLFALKYTKNFYIVLTLGVLAWIFITFVMKSFT